MYYVFERFFAKHPARDVADYPFIPDMDFDLGERIAVEVPRPLEFDLAPLNPNANDTGPNMPEYFKGPIPLLREDLIAAMRQAGVDNLDLYDAVIRDPESGKSYDNYKAVNIVGVVAAADMAKSEYTAHPGGAVIDVDFRHLVLDESKPAGALIFRLAEATGAIIVHERLRDHLRSAGFNALEFLDPEDVAL